MKTTNIEIILPEYLVVSFGTGTDTTHIETALASIPHEIIARAVEYGWQQKNADAAASAADVACDEALGPDAPAEDRKAWKKDEANKEAILAKRKAMIEESIKERVEGNWTVTRQGSGVSSVVVWQRKAVRELAKSHKGLATNLKAFKGEPEARNAYLDEVATNNPDVIAAIVKRLQAEAEARRNAASKAASDLSL